MTFPIKQGAACCFAPIPKALHELARGRMVVVVDDPDRENEGDLIVAAEHATAHNIGFMIRHTGGVICVAMGGADLDRLELAQMVAHNTDTKGTAFTVSVDLRIGTTTGIGAAERAQTIRHLAEASAAPDDFRRPGHVFPLRARPGGTLERAGHTEAGVDLATLAGLRPAAALSEIVGEDGEPLRLPALTVFAQTHELAIISIKDLVEYRKVLESRNVEAVGQDFRAHRA